MKIIEKDASGNETTLYPEAPAVATATFQELADKLGDLPCTVLATAGPPKPKQRPHLDVLIDRAKRRIAHVERLVDEVRELAECDGLDGIATEVLVAARGLVEAMVLLRRAGCTGNVTAKSRALARLRPGTRVRFVDEESSTQFEGVYGEVELTIDRRVENHVWLKAGDVSAGRALWSEVIPVDEEAGK